MLLTELAGIADFGAESAGAEQRPRVSDCIFVDEFLTQDISRLLKSLNSLFPPVISRLGGGIKAEGRCFSLTRRVRAIKGSQAHSPGQKNRRDQ